MEVAVGTVAAVNNVSKYLENVSRKFVQIIIVLNARNRLESQSDNEFKYRFN